VRSPLHSLAVVDAWLDLLRPQQQPVVRDLRELVRETVPSLAPAVKWGNLVFLHHGRHALAIAVQKDHAQLQLFNGARLTRRHPQLEGGGPEVRHLQFRFDQPVDAQLVRDLVVDCIEAMG